MNPPTQSPSPGHRAPRRRIARELFGLFLAGTGAVGLLGSVIIGLLEAVYIAAPLVVMGLAGIILAASGGAVLYISPPLPRAVRLTSGYCALLLGLLVLIFVAARLAPWSLLFTLMLAVGVALSSEEE
ncbi:hypothetical protein [Streptomyces rimosus]|uniref:hypothetical protein n=1 Tax=Streptomyces rimosus TaxID=1927 RepID=UPI0004BFA03D|nr:hypothetical protein [Streptomyces rimosus]